MSATCSATFDQLARQLGSFSCSSIKPVIHIRNPLHLSNWTLPVIEALMIVGAVLALVHAVQRLRRHSDPTNLAIWFGSIVYLLVTEPPLYFPKTFGLPASLADVFAHNVFTVQFMYDRLPLYIVALYPTLTSLAYEIVRALGVFRRNVLIAAITMGFVHHLFYEVFDQLGPQVKWWIWNTEAKTNHPMLASVPMTSVFIFAVLGPAALTMLVRLFVGRKADRGEPIGGWSLAGRTIAAGVLVPVLVAIGSLPTSLVGDGNTAKAVVLALGVVLFATIGATVLVQQWRLTRATRDEHPATRPWFVLGFGSLYLAVFFVLWATALPAYFAATDGTTTDGTPTGSLIYAGICAVLAATTLLAVATATKSARSPVPEAAAQLT